VNPKVVAPLGAVVLAGTVTLELLPERVRVNPPLGAAPLSVPVHAAVPGPVTEDGLQESAVGTTVDAFTTQAPPGKLELTTRCTVTTVHTPEPLIFAVHGDKPSVILTARLTSRTLSEPSAFKSHAFIALPTTAADLNDTVLLIKSTRVPTFHLDW
jgi:hypothetical protein